MGNYLNDEIALERMLAEYQTENKFVVAFDFDGTVCDYNHSNPEPTFMRAENKEICDLLRRAGKFCHMVLWTCRVGMRLAEAIEWLDNHKVPYDNINENPFIDYGGAKIHNNILLDDRAGLSASFNLLTKFVDTLEVLESAPQNFDLH